MCRPFTRSRSSTATASSDSSSSPACARISVAAVSGVIKPCCAAASASSNNIVALSVCALIPKTSLRVTTSSVRAVLRGRPFLRSGIIRAERGGHGGPPVQDYYFRGYTPLVLCLRHLKLIHLSLRRYSTPERRNHLFSEPSDRL